MDINTFVTTVGREVVWSGLSALITLVFTFIVGWLVVGCSPNKLFHEMVDGNNGGIGALFFAISLIVSQAVSKVIADPTQTSGYADTLFWLAVALAASIPVLAVFTVVSLAIFSPKRPKGMGMIKFIHHELLVDKNAGLGLYLGAIGVSTMIPSIAIVMGG